MSDWSDFITCKGCGHRFTRFVITHARGCLIGYKKDSVLMGCIECTLEFLTPMDPKKIVWEEKKDE